jgi:hypothetical protein
MKTNQNEFNEIVKEITNIGIEWHSDGLERNATLNKPYIKKSIKALHSLEGEMKNSAIVISAGPSVHRTKAVSKI